jgi:tRNA modification GTPase
LNLSKPSERSIAVETSANRGNSETVACQLTAPGRGAIATVWISGSCALEIVDRFFRAASGMRLVEIPTGRLVFGAWRHDQGLEDVVVVRPNADSVEIHTHGGWLAPRLLIQSLRGEGVCEVVCETALARIRGNPWQAAALMVAQRALTLPAANRLLRNAEELLLPEVEALAAMIPDPASDPETIRRLRALANSFRFGRRLIEGWTVVIAGRPNVGKSTLINRLVGFSRSIVFDQPGTTRDVVRQRTAVGGWPVQLCDTAGLRSTADAIERIGVQSTDQAIRAADLMIWMSDLSLPWSDEDRRAIESVRNYMLVHNKADITPRFERRPEGLVVSLLGDHPIDAILSAIEQRLFANLPSADRPFLVCEWQLAAVERAIEQLERGARWDAARALRQPANAPYVVTD